MDTMRFKEKVWSFLQQIMLKRMERKDNLTVENVLMDIQKLLMKDEEYAKLNEQERQRIETVYRLLMTDFVTMVEKYGTILAMFEGLQTELDSLSNTLSPNVAGHLSAGHQSGFFDTGDKKVQVYLPTPNPTMEAFFDALREVLGYKCEIRRAIGELESNLPLVVVCSRSSRFETDINNAIKGLKHASLVRDRAQNWKTIEKDAFPEKEEAL